MPESVTLRADVHGVRIGDDLVVLDVAAGLYLCWPDVPSLSMSPDRRRIFARDPGLLEALGAAGLTTPKELPPPRSPVEPLRPAYDLADTGDGGLGPRRSGFLPASLDAVFVYPRLGFSDLVRFGQAHPPGVDPNASPPPEMVALVAAFHRWACWTPAPAKCLIRSFMLLRQLRRHGFDAHWVFAVRTWPVEAHCWLQAGPVVLDDAIERLTAYHPILVV